MDGGEGEVGGLDCVLIVSPLIGSAIWHNFLLLEAFGSLGVFIYNQIIRGPWHGIKGGDRKGTW